MNTDHHNQRACSRPTAHTIVASTAGRRGHVSIMAAAMLISAGANLAGLLGAASASAAPTDNFVAIAAGDVDDAPPVQAVAGFAAEVDADAANQLALTNCSSVGGRQCVVVVAVQGQCVAVAADDFGNFQGGFGPTPDTAFQNAMAPLENKQGAKVLRTGCAADVSAPPRPGPTVTFNPIVGGLEAHITDRSGVPSQCTYTMDNFNRSFALSANSADDLKILPAIPLFRDRNVTIKCDNGTSTQTTTKF